MDTSSRIGGAVTPAKEKTRSKLNEAQRCSENVNPNVSSPGPKFSNSPAVVKSEKGAKKSALGNPNPNQVSLASPSAKKKIRQRKFLIAKKKSRNEELNSMASTAAACEKCKMAIGKSKCLCLAYESLRASQEEFFKDSGEIEDEVSEKLKDFEKEGVNPKINNGFGRKMEENNVLSETRRGDKDNVDQVVVNGGEMGVKRSRERLLEEARETVPTPPSGMVMHLIKEFEKLSTLKLGNSEETDVDNVKGDKDVANSALDGLEQRPKAAETQVSSSSFCPSDFFLTSESLGLDSRRSYSLDSSQESISTITSVGGRKTRRSSTESALNRARRQWKRKQLKATTQKPFMLRTEERGRYKEEEFMKKLRQIEEEEEKMRIPVAQGLPLTTDEPECLVKPSVKEITKPIDLALHSDIRAIDRSDFDHQVAMKLQLIEQYQMERERQRKMEEEEAIKRLRKELIPKAQPMPYFDRPFIPRRSEKQPTVPKEPKFHIPELKKIKCHSSMDDFSAYQQ